MYELLLFTPILNSPFPRFYFLAFFNENKHEYELFKNVTLLLKNIYSFSTKSVLHCFINNGRLLLNLNALKRHCYSDRDPVTKTQFVKYIMNFQNKKIIIKKEILLNY